MQAYIGGKRKPMGRSMSHETAEDVMTSRRSVAARSAGRGHGSADPGAALWRVVGALTPAHARHLAHEIEILALAVASERPDGRPVSSVPEGVRPRHSSWCPSHRGDTCGCAPRWEAWVYSRRDRAKVRKSFAEYGKQRHGVTNNSSSQATISSSPQAAGPSPSSEHAGSHLHRKGRSATVPGVLTSQARCARSSKIYAGTWSHSSATSR